MSSEIAKIIAYLTIVGSIIAFITYVGLETWYIPSIDDIRTDPDAALDEFVNKTAQLAEKLVEEAKEEARARNCEWNLGS